MKSVDIARLAGVSRSTVSRVVNNYPNVPEKTRQKVMKVINEYNYMPNSFARSLAGKRSNTIGLFFIINGGMEKEERLSKNDFFASYLDIIVDIANEKDYYVLVSIVSDESKYLKISQAFLEKRIDAGIIIGTQDDTLERINAQSYNTSMILFDYDMSKEEAEKYENTSFTMINSNDHIGIDKAVEYLHNLGHREIGFIKGRQTSRSGNVRFSAFKQALKRRNLSIKQEYILEGDFSIDTAYSETKKAIKDNKLASAYISANDYMALGAMRAFKEEGYNVPQDISVIGFDNTDRAQELDLKLTTIGPDFYGMAKKAIDVLDEQIKDQNKKYNLQVFEYDVEFFKRDTCKKL